MNLTSKLKPRAKHPVKMHVLESINRGATEVCVRLDSSNYQQHVVFLFSRSAFQLVSTAS